MTANQNNNSDFVIICHCLYIIQSKQLNLYQELIITKHHTRRNIHRHEKLNENI